MRRQRKQPSKLERLRRAPTWIATYPGKDIVRGYRKHFGVDYPTAFRELEQLGITIDPERKQRILVGLAQQPGKAENRKLKDERGTNAIIDLSAFSSQLSPAPSTKYSRTRTSNKTKPLPSSPVFTSGGAPYGVTWEELHALDEADEAESEVGE